VIYRACKSINSYKIIFNSTVLRLLFVFINNFFLQSINLLILIKFIKICISSFLIVLMKMCLTFKIFIIAKFFFTEDS